MLVGKSSNREIPAFFVEKIGTKVRTFASPNFCYGKDHKKVKLTKSILFNITVRKLREYKKSVNLIHRRIEKTGPDVVIILRDFGRIDDVEFLKYMQGCSGCVTTAGFESVCEAMYLGKPVMMIPAHVEQEINAADASAVGAGIVNTTFDISRLMDHIPHYATKREVFREWGDSAEELFIRHLTTLV